MSQRPSTQPLEAIDELISPFFRRIHGTIVGICTLLLYHHLPQKSTMKMSGKYKYNTAPMDPIMGICQKFTSLKTPG